MTWTSVRELSPEHVDDLYALFQHEWWTSDRSREGITRMIANSDEIIGLVDDDTDALVAFARVLTDYTYKALIFDVVVASSFRNQGLGTRLMDELTTLDTLEAVGHFELYCLDDMTAFYDQWEFTDDVDGLRLLRRDHAAKNAA